MEQPPLPQVCSNTHSLNAVQLTEFVGPLVFGSRFFFHCNFYIRAAGRRVRQPRPNQGEAPAVIFCPAVDVPSQIRSSSKFPAKRQKKDPFFIGLRGTNACFLLLTDGA